MAKAKKPDANHEQIAELTGDLQRTRADFENYRKRVESEKLAARNVGRSSAIEQLLPVIDDIERALSHMPDELKDNTWANGVAGLEKKLQKALESLGLTRIDATKGVHFNPDLHEAVQFDEDGEGEHEVVAEELRAGYLLGDSVLRPAMVRVNRG
jgi:molecular chaperone GrpE